MKKLFILLALLAPLAAQAQSSRTGSAAILGTDSVGTAEIATDGVDSAEIAENAVAPDELAATTFTIDFCGQNDENGTIFLGPVVTDYFLSANAATVDASIGGTVCDALDNATEATADAPVLTDVAFKVTGMYCFTDGTLGAAETLTFALRTAEGATVPSVTCALAEAEVECASTVATTTDIAAGATVAVSATQVSNNTDDNSWCRVYGSFK